MVELTLVGVRVEVPSNQPIVLLREAEGSRFLPIWIGPSEATAIALALQGIEQPRPMTHDLMRDLLDTLGVELARVVVTELRDQTFFAVLELAAGDRREEISSRPSDAIALAVRTGSPIFASEEVLDEASILVSEEDEESEVERFRSFLDQVNPEDFA